MGKIKRNKIIQYVKLTFIILIIILVSCSQFFETKNGSDKLSSKDVTLLVVYISGIILIPLLTYYIGKLRKQKYWFLIFLYENNFYVNIIRKLNIGQGS